MPTAILIISAIFSFQKNIAIQVTLNVNDTANGIRITRRDFQGITDAADDAVWCWQCIREMTVMIHGNSHGSIIENPYGKSSWITPNNAQGMFDSFTGEEDFCSECTIYWLSCDTGLGDLPQVIANTTKCTVYAPNGVLYSGSEHDPLNSLVCKRYNYQTGTCEEYHKKGEGFSEFSPK